MEYTVMPAADKTAPLVVICGEEESLDELRDELEKRSDNACSLVLFRVEDWNRELSPWPADPVMKKTEPFGGQADMFLKAILTEGLPAVLQEYELQPEWTGIAGYSLAGLFALYSMYQTDRFDRYVSASGSMWYPGFVDYCKTHEPKKTPQAVYLSLGDAEAKTRHPLLKIVQDCTEEVAALYQTNKIPVQYELNPGNHFKDATIRLAKGIAWILNQD